jgi:DNA-binding LacI/PurR family transcriptional regulator
LEDNPFFAQVARAVEQHALTLGYSVQVSYSALDMPPEDRQPRSGASRPAGAVVLGRFVDQGIVRTLERQYRNIVFVGRSPISAGWDQVICDGYEATAIAIDHLIDYGHRRIGYIGEIKNEVRYQAFTDTLKRHDLKAPSGLVAACDHNSPEGGYEGAGILLKKANPLPTAVFCASDVAAIAALRRFRESKIRVPSQLSIISMDNTELSAWITPMLTTVEMPIVEMGAVAVQTLVGRINRLHGLPQKIYLPNKLAPRESVVNLNEGLYI